MFAHTENRIWQLYAKALAAKTPEDTNRAVQTKLTNKLFVGRRLVETQINNLACLNQAVRTTSAASSPSQRPNRATEGFNETEARMVHTVPVFNIFSGRFGEKDVVWLGAVEGLDAAREGDASLCREPTRRVFCFSLG